MRSPRESVRAALAPVGSLLATVFLDRRARPGPAALPAPRPDQAVVGSEYGEMAPRPVAQIYRGEPDPERAGRPRLVVVTDNKAHADSPEAAGQNEDLLIHYGECTIGRAPEVAIRLDDPMVSPVHGAFRRFARDGWDVVAYHDLGSLNGTNLNGVPILDVELTDGDRLQLGNTQLVFRRDKNEP